jgi:hypothetical protein
MCGRVSRSLAARLVGKLKRGCGTCHAVSLSDEMALWPHCSKASSLHYPLKQYSGHRVRIKRFEDRGLDLRLPA